MSFNDNEIINTGSEIYINTAFEMIYLDFGRYGTIKSGYINIIKPINTGKERGWILYIRSQNNTGGLDHNYHEISEIHIVKLILKSKSCFDRKLLERTIKKGTYGFK